MAPPKKHGSPRPTERIPRERSVGLSVSLSIMVAELPEQTQIHRFTLVGDVWPLVGLRKALGAYRPTRPMGGWLMTYGKIGPDGGIIPTVDREEQVMEAAKELGHIDWRSYVKGGRWNDTHDEALLVGLPTTLEFHDATTDLAKAHRKVGFWTTGHLFDRADSRSWHGLVDEKGNPMTPTPKALDRADAFWETAHLLKGTPRPLGLSAHGEMALSKCGKRIIYARVTAAAVCELPMNPDATLEPMLLAAAGSPLQVLRKGMATDSRCGRCTCPAGSCLRMEKGVVQQGDLQVTTQEEDAFAASLTSAEKLRKLVDLIVAGYHVSEDDAKRWIRNYLRSRQVAPVVTPGSLS